MKPLILSALAACLGWGWLGLRDTTPLAPTAEAAPAPCEVTCEAITCERISPVECLVRCEGPDGQTCERTIRCDAPCAPSDEVTLADVAPATAPATCGATCERVSPAECVVRCSGPNGEVREERLRCDEPRACQAPSDVRHPCAPGTGCR